MSKLNVMVSRTVSPTEVESLIHGTGMLGYSWWKSVDPTPTGYRIRHENGSAVVTTEVTIDQIVRAASEWLGEQAGSHWPTGDIRDAISEDLGYLDAAGADAVMQLAVMKQVVFG